MTLTVDGRLSLDKISNVDEGLARVAPGRVDMDSHQQRCFRSWGGAEPAAGFTELSVGHLWPRARVPNLDEDL